VNLNALTRKAKDLIDKRGGVETLKQDAAELKKIATGPGSPGDKAKAAAKAVKTPGGNRSTAGTQPAGDAPPPVPPGPSA
jgi:hypothetical protein